MNRLTRLAQGEIQRQPAENIEPAARPGKQDRVCASSKRRGKTAMRDRFIVIIPISAPQGFSHRLNALCRYDAAVIDLPGHKSAIS